MSNRSNLGHLAAIITMLVWGTTFVSTKILLEDFIPVEILFFRFVMGLLVLTVIYPHRMKGVTKRQELTFAAAGLSGICLYYLLENIALTYSLASNLGVILSVTPFFTAILTQLFLKGEEKLNARFFIGFIVSMAGICLISFNGSRLQLNPLGDLLAVIAGVVWASYSILTKKISAFGYNIIQTTRRTFAYGLLFMIPALFLFHSRPGLERFADPLNLGNIIFLGLGASALCFVTWNMAVRILGVVKTSVYIYIGPVITVVTSAVFLKEPITLMLGIGTVLTLAGVVLSEYKPNSH